MQSTTLAIHNDIHDLQVQSQSLKKKGFPVYSLSCGLCGQHLAKACGKAVVFQCCHKYHQSCLSNAGCLRQVFDKGQDLWLCYACLKSRATIEDENQIVISAEQDEDEEAPSELVNDITNQQVVKAHALIKGMKKNRSLLQDEEAPSIFQREDFKLKLSKIVNE